MNKVVLYCRPGFEKECAAEITDKAARLEVFGFARVKEDSGYVIFEGYQQDDGEKLVRDLPFSSLIFARQMFVVGELLRDLPPEDRITPIVGMLQGVVEKGGELRVEVADTNESKELMKFCRKFTVPLRAALREAGVLTNYETPKRPVVHVFFIAPGCCYTGYSYSNNNSPFYMGIPRLKFPPTPRAVPPSSWKRRSTSLFRRTSGTSVWRTACMPSISAPARAAGPISW